MPDGGMYTNAHSFEPGPSTERTLRDCLGRFASGVTVVTAATPEGGIGMTANSFTSVSMDPALVLWCPAKASSRYPAFAAARHFAIHVLRAEQEDVARAFARSARAFEALPFHMNSAGVPVFDDCLARFDCETDRVHDAGDHAIIVARVRAARFADGAPLVFSQGRFIRFDNMAENANQ